MMAMLSENSKQHTSRTTLVWVFVIIDVWATSNVKMTIVLSLFALVFGMKSHGQVTPHRFLLQVILPLVLLCAPIHKFCVGVHFYVDEYKCKIYYVVHKFITLTKAMICFIRHDHLVQDDMCKDGLEEIKALVEDEVYCT
jgi:hypothetical protein